MGRMSTKGDKTPYQIARERLELTRERASEIMGVEPSKIERIENEKNPPDTAKTYRFDLNMENPTAAIKHANAKNITKTKTK